MDFLKEFLDFAMTRKKLWMLPIVFFLLAISILAFLTQASVIAPFIYTLF